jgi:hypothetical protein
MSAARKARHVLATTLAVCAAGTLAAGPASAHSGPSVLLTGLSSPKGLTLAPGGNPVVGQGAFGAPGPLLEYRRRGHGTTRALTGPLNLVDVAAARDGSVWAIRGASAPGQHVTLVRRDRKGRLSTVLDITAYQAADPDPTDHDNPPNPTESNPYGLAALPNGDALLTDAAGNDLIRVTPSRRAWTVARFGLEAVRTDHLPPAQRPPGTTFLAEAVPTTVTVGRDGYAYVGELKGFPFRPGTSHVWRVDPRAKGATCTPGVRSRQCRVYRSGLTAIQDIAFDRRGNLFVYELAKDGVLAFEAGLAPGGTFPPAVLLKLRAKHGYHGGAGRSELARGRLSQPGGIAVRGRDVFVTDGVFTGGRLLRLRG